jgi:hypothetical protein
MNLSTVWYTVQDLFQAFSPARRELKLYQFNNYLQLADDELLITLLRMKYNPSSETEANNEQLDVLQKFKKSTSVSAATAVNLPTGYVRHIAAYTSGGVEIDYVSLEEYTDRKSNSLTVPSTTYPVFYVTNGTIVTDPTTLGTYTFWYYAQNTGASKPSLVLKSENGIFVYDSTSVQLVWPEYMYERIIMLMLKYLGISINDPAIIQEKLKSISDATV